MKTAIIIFFLTIYWRGLLSQVQVPPYPDNSPKNSAWVKMGLTVPTIKWAGPDYKKAIDLLDLVYEADKFSLPRKYSDYSGAIYDRMLSRKNFDYLYDEDQNFGNVIVEYEKIKGIAYRLLIYYIEDTEPTERFGVEVLDCLLLDAWLNTNGIILYDKIANQLTPTQLTSPNFRRGYEEVKREFERSMDAIFEVLEKDFMRYDTDLLKKYTVTFTELLKELSQKKKGNLYLNRCKTLSKRIKNKEISKILKLND